MNQIDDPLWGIKRKGKEVIGIALSDAHSANWKQFNKEGQRLLIWEKAMNEVIRAATEYNCPILFAGDLFDHPKHLDNVVLDVFARVSIILKIAGIKFVGINGNHDFHKKSSFHNMALGYMHHFSRMLPKHFVCIDYTFWDSPRLRVHGIPYINGNSDFADAFKKAKKNRAKDKKNILLIHTDLPGAKEPDGREVGTAENIDYKEFKAFDLVLSGHIHRFQKLRSNTYMLGAPMQQRRSDAGTKMGYCLIYSDMTVKHIPLKLPEFKFYEFGEEKPDTEDFWIERPAPITVIDHESAGLHFDVKSDRNKLARNYMKAKGVKSKSKRELLIKYLND